MTASFNVVIRIRASRAVFRLRDDRDEESGGVVESGDGVTEVDGDACGEAG
jgi:hypothetical protein